MVDGEVSAGWEPVREAFARVVDIDEAGASLSIVQAGSTVVDLWGGSDPVTGRPWESDSVVLTFSTAKGVLALLAALAVQSGDLDPSAPVARYWPEFASNGKDRITVRDTLTHVAGLPVLPLTSVSDLATPIELAARLAEEPPAYEPRSARIYHVLSYGTLVGELLRRVTGRDIGALVTERIAEPLGRNGAGTPGGSMWFGLPAEQDHRLRRSLMGPAESPLAPPETAGPACDAAYRANAQIMPLFERVGGVMGTEPMNGPEFVRAQVGGGGLIADARSLARMYGACTAEVDGVRLLDDDTVARVTTDQLGGITEPVYLPDAVPTTRWGLGFELSHVPAPMLGEGSFGHTGMGGRLSFAHVPSRLGFSFVGQRMSFPAPGQDERWRMLLAAVEESLAH